MSREEPEVSVFVFPPTSLHKALAVPEPRLKLRKGANTASMQPFARSMCDGLLF